MDFEKILRMAKKNELYKKEQPVKCLQTKFKPPTKEQHEKDRMLSEGVQRFLARKEEEEKRKQLEAERRKRELMALRAKDPKANKRIQTMLKRTKSANKSVMDDAVDNNNTADTLAGPSQPDEDDYGFVSETSSQLYNKLIQKMYSTPDDSPKFTPSKKPSGGNLSNTKERVKMALLKQEEEERLPHKRRRKGKDKRDDEEDDVTLDYSAPDRDISKNSSEHKERPDKPKVKRPLPPPVDFQELLKIAEQKQHEPIVFEPKVKKPQEPEVLMTKKQKLEYERMQEWKRQKEVRLQNLENGERTSSAQEEKKPISRIPKINQSSSDNKSTTSSSSSKKLNGHDDRLNNKVKGQDKNDRNLITNRPKDLNEKNHKHKPAPDRKPSNHTASDKKYKDISDETERLIKERDEALRILKEKEKLIRERDEAVRKLKEKEQLIRERDEAVRKLKLLEESEKLKNSAKNNVKSSESSISKSGISSQKLINSKTSVKNTEISKSSSSKSDLKNLSSKSSTPVNKNGLGKSNSKLESKGVSERSGVREFPPRDMKPLMKPGSREAAIRNFQRSKQFPPGDVRRKGLNLKRRRIESDDEYDSELDDFIDDDANDIAPEEVSKVISEIFKYDKNKYSRYDDADDECMESNFAQISKEEFFSTKCGLLEDLEDIRREKAKLARKQRR